MKMKNMQIGGGPWCALEYADTCQDSLKRLFHSWIYIKNKQNNMKKLQKSKHICFMYAAQTSTKAIWISGSMKFLSTAQ